jgi:hypothetical protein
MIDTEQLVIYDGQRRCKASGCRGCVWRTVQGAAWRAQAMADIAALLAALQSLPQVCCLWPACSCL